MTNVAEIKKKKKSIDFDFIPGEDVVIKALNVKGKVMGVCSRLDDAAEYNIQYWYDGHRKTEWMYIHEIEPYKGN